LLFGVYLYSVKILEKPGRDKLYELRGSSVVMTDKGRLVFDIASLEGINNDPEEEGATDAPCEGSIPGPLVVHEANLREDLPSIGKMIVLLAARRHDMPFRAGHFGRVVRLRKLFEHLSDIR
jgi:hypothetical protein